MNFTNRIRREIMRCGVDSACCEFAMLSAYLHASLEVMKTSDGYGFEVQTDDRDAADFCSGLIAKLFGLDAGYYALKEDRLHGCERVVLQYSGRECFQILQELGFLSKEETPELLSGISSYLIENECCHKAYVKGAFLGAGSATLPERETDRSTATGYHLQFLFRNYDYASDFCNILAQYDFMPKLIERKNGYVVYFKNSQAISDLLAFMDASQSVLFLQERLVEKSFQNRINRQTNCEMGNMTKQVNASVAQKMAILALSDLVGMDRLPESLVVVCQARLDHPNATLEELADLLDLSKSCVNHRLRKIMSLYRSLSKEEE